jgi:hypothetical protein
MLSLRFLAMPVIALAVIVALSQAHSGAPGNSEGATRTVYRAVNCAIESTNPTCAIAGNNGATFVR